MRGEWAGLPGRSVDLGHEDIDGLVGLNFLRLRAVAGIVARRALAVLYCDLSTLITWRNNARAAPGGLPVSRSRRALATSVGSGSA